MRSNIRIAAIIASVMTCSAASAGQFNVWTYESGNQSLVTVSFAGEGSSQEAQLDLNLPAGYEVVEAKALVNGAVCVGSAKSGLLRAVPPSGAGKPLPSAESDYCSFVLKSSGGIKGPGGVQLTKRMTECAGVGSPQCQVEILDVSDSGNGARGRNAPAKPGRQNQQ